MHYYFCALYTWHIPKIESEEEMLKFNQKEKVTSKVKFKVKRIETQSEY